MDRKNKILQAAQKLFGQFGLKKVTIEDIAKEASVSKVTLYKYFRDKDDVFEEVVRFEGDQMFRAIEAAVARETDTAGKFKAHLMVKFEKIDELVNFYQMTRESMNEHWPHIDEVSECFLEKEKELVVGILKSGQESRELNVKEVELTAQVMVVALKSLEFSAATERWGGDLENYVDLLVDMMLNGLRRK